MIQPNEAFVAPQIVLATLNARYIHSAFGLRYLKANLREYQEQCIIQEYTLDSRPEDIVESILLAEPRLVGFGVYIWNVIQTEKVVALLKTVAPEIVVVLGGPEVSYEQDGQEIISLADHVITGWGEVSFYDLVAELANDGVVASAKIIKGIQPKLDQIEMPYYLYNEEDIKNRVLYVEASRGCPFKCEFCLSALDKTAWPFDQDLFLEQMDDLYKRGARHFKFVDRTFNLKVKNSLRIMQFFLDRMSDDLFLHFEVVPDHLPDDLKDMIAKFPQGQLQFEVGIQTFNQDVQTKISRRQNNQKAEQNIRWIRNESKAYLHTDLIFGLPGESLDSFAHSFDQLVALNPHEIQVGILKRLKGSPIIRHTEAHRLSFNPNPPFSIVSSDQVSFSDVQFIGRFARYWDLIGNSGRFKQTLPLLLEQSPFKRFSLLTNSLFTRSRQTHKISLLRLFDFVYDIALSELNIELETLKSAITSDFNDSGLKSMPKCLKGDRSGTPVQVNIPKAEKNKKRPIRQSRH
ncbi:MAG: DUF4080 domain-containing protein [Gammaproteobacteria bacterium]|nr:DUF4080 domain-containing protein [Gammaproteobacteria bacterium]